MVDLKSGTEYCCFQHCRCSARLNGRISSEVCCGGLEGREGARKPIATTISLCFAFSLYDPQKPSASCFSPSCKQFEAAAQQSLFLFFPAPDKTANKTANKTAAARLVGRTCHAYTGGSENFISSHRPDSSSLFLEFIFRPEHFAQPRKHDFPIQDQKDRCS